MQVCRCSHTHTKSIPTELHFKAVAHRKISVLRFQVSPLHSQGLFEKSDLRLDFRYMQEPRSWARQQEQECLPHMHLLPASSPCQTLYFFNQPPKSLQCKCHSLVSNISKRRINKRKGGELIEVKQMRKRRKCIAGKDATAHFHLSSSLTHTCTHTRMAFTDDETPKEPSGGGQIELKMVNSESVLLYPTSDEPQ